MLKDKNPKPTEYKFKAKVHKSDTTLEPEAENALIEMYQAARRAILTIREDPNEPDSEPFFKTVKIDNGQYNRLVLEDNLEGETLLPAVFIHYTNVRYLVQQQRIGQGRAIMRVRFILNTLNNSDELVECEPFTVFQRINQAIQDAKDREPALTERCNLLYFDMPTTTNMFQAYWIDYEVWFRETSGWKYRNWVPRYVVMPPFTDHADAPEHDKDSHGRHPEPSYDQSTGTKPSVGGSGGNSEED